MQEHVIIIGNGIAGITAARHIRKHSNYSITVISSETKYHYSRTALMYIYMGHMKHEHTQPYEADFWVNNNIQLLQAKVDSILTHNHTIQLQDGTTLNYTHLVLATGSKSNKYGWPGQELTGVQGLYHIQDVHTMQTYTQGIQHAVVVGGGLIGIETVEMLLSRNIKVTFLVREASFWNLVLPPNESILINNLIHHHGVDLQLGTELKEIIGDANGRVQAVVTSKGDTIACGFVALTVGVSPNIAYVLNGTIATDRGILVNEYLTTNIPNVYAIGDCAQHTTPPPGRRPIEQVWYTGKLQGEAVARTITGTPTVYQPGHWFNSAKFFDLEYQTYGTVNAQLNAHEAWHWWQNAKATKGLRLVWHKDTNQFIGLNSFGIRIRHQVCNDWLNAQATIQQVVHELHKANFDPEFFQQYEKEFTQHFNKHSGVVA